MKRIYLASPYSHPELAVRLERTARVRRVCARLNERPGINCYSPVNHGHDLPHHPEVAKCDAFWRPLNEDEIRRSDELHVLMLDGWDVSVGVTREIDYATSLGKPVVYISESGHVIATKLSVRKEAEAEVVS